MRILCLFAASAGLACAQCYSFSAPGVTYTMNIMGVESAQYTSVLSSLIVTQQSTLTVGGKTYVGPIGPGNVSFESDGGESNYMSAALSILQEPVWQVDINLVGMLTLLPQTPPASLPPVTAWQVVPPQLEYSISGGPAIKLTITAIGTCSGGGGGGGGASTVPGPTLGDPSSQIWCPVCGFPINLGTGNMFEQAVDYQTFGANRLSFTRYYNSMSAAATLASSLGVNWRSTYDRYLNISASSVVAERPDGQQVTFQQNGGAWTTDSDLDFTLANSGSIWTLTDHSDTVETYTAVTASEGLLQSVQARNGYKQTLNYNSNQQLTSVTDSFNRQLSFTYSNGLLQTFTTPDGLILTYGFTPTGSSSQLTSVNYSTKPATGKTYLYESSSLPGALTGIMDENGTRYMSWTYDSKGRALTSQKANGADLTTIAYNDSDGSRTFTNALGEQVLYKFTTLQGIPKIVEADRIPTAGVSAAKSTYTYDSNGYMASETDWNGNQTTFTFDSRGEIVAMNEAVGTPQARATTITYQPAFHLPVHIVTPGLIMDLTYDQAGELLTKTLTDTTATTVPYSTNGQTRTWTYTWSNYRLASVRGPRTDVAQLTQFGYSPDGTLTSITNPLNQTAQITRHLTSGLPQTIVDPNGVTTTLSYDARQRLLSTSLATAAGALSSTNTYDAAGNLLSATLPDGSKFTNTYDAAHRVTGASDTLGDSVAITLDALGNRTQITAQANGAAQLKRSAAYDALGRILQSVGGAGQISAITYDSEGNALTVTDPLNRSIQQSFDALNRRVKFTDPLNGSVVVSYDAHSRPVSVTDPSGATTTYTYDGFGDLIQRVSPASGTSTYRLDPSGNVVQKIDGRGVVANLSYDALNRLTAVAYPANPAENATFTYDEAGHGFSVGRLTSVSDPSGAFSRSYDERGNVLSESRRFPNAASTIGYTYDAASRLASLTYPSGWSVAYQRDAMGRLTGMSAAAPGGGSSRQILSSVSYQPFGPVSGLTYGNGIAEKRAFDQDYRLTGISAQGIQNLSYNQDASNEVLGITDGLNASNTQTLAYDPLDRLVSASGAYGKLAYSYDSNGRRLTETSPATGDGLGQVAALTYNQAGRLAAVYNGSAQLTHYTYDAFGRRLMKVGAITATTLYQYDASGRLLEESDGQGKAQVDYLYFGGRPVAAIQGGGSIYFLHTDRLGTPVAATGSNQSNLWSTTYQPFGEIGGAPSNIAMDLRLPGQEADIETGLYHNGFRDYVPAWGGYSMSDPIDLAGGMNTYAYAGGNPVTFTDPLGLDCPLASIPTSAQVLAMTGDPNAAALWSQALQLNSSIASAYSDFTNGLVDALSEANSVLANAESDLADGAVDALSMFNSDVASAESSLADGLADLATTWAEGSDEFANLGICMDAELLGSAADWIVNGADASWGALTSVAAVEKGTASAGPGGSMATYGIGVGFTAIGVANSVAQAPAGMKGAAFSASALAATAGGTAEVLAAARIGTFLQGSAWRAPAVGIGGAAAGYFIGGAVKCGLAFAAPQLAPAIL